MTSGGTSLSSLADTLRNLMREPDRLSIWLNETDLRETALKSLTGRFTSPKLMDPLQMARGMPLVCPTYGEFSEPLGSRDVAIGQLDRHEPRRHGDPSARRGRGRHAAAHRRRLVL